VLGLVDIIGKKNTTKEEFWITDKGTKKIHDKYSKLPTEISSSLRKWRKGLDQLGTNGILKYVYDYYPQFKTKSKIAHRYKSISWGQGRG
jgi:hypothetical protein